MPAKIDLPRQALVDFCRRWHVTELAFFGSVLRDDFRPDSDVDVLVRFAPGAAPGWDFVTMREELSQLLGRRVDILTRVGVDHAPDPRLREEILGTAEVIYAA
jgi:uncharacterized protein